MQTIEATTSDNLQKIDQLKVVLSFALKNQEDAVFKVYEEQQANFKNHLWLLSLIFAALASLPIETHADKLNFSSTVHLIISLTFFASLCLGAYFSCRGFILALKEIKSQELIFPSATQSPFFKYLSEGDSEDRFLPVLKEWIDSLDKSVLAAIESSNKRGKTMDAVNLTILRAGSCLLVAFLSFLFIKFL